MEYHGDFIQDLPENNTEPSPKEIHIVNTMFKQHEGTMTKIGKELNDLVIVGVLFVLFSLPQVDDLIKRFFSPAVNSVYILVGIKTVIVMILFWVIKYFYLSKKK